MSDFKIVKLVDPIVVQTNGVNASITGNTAGTAAVVSSGTMYLAGGNNITLSQSQNTISINGGAGAGAFAAGVSNIGNTSGNTKTVNNQVVLAGGNNITLSQSTNAGGATVTVSAPNQSVQTQNLVSVLGSSGNISFDNGNGVTFGGNGSTITASVKTDYQTSGNYLTTARASNDAIGLNTAKTNVTWTVNSSGISLDGGAYLTTAMASNRGTDFVQANANFNGTNASGTIASNNISVSVAAQSVQTQNLHNVTLSGNTAGVMAQVSSGTLTLAGGNNITLSQNGNAITISGGAAGGADGVNILAAGTQTANTTGTVKFADSNGISFGMSNSSQVTASYTVPSTAGLISAINLSAGTTSQNLSKVTFDNSNGVSFGLNGSVVTATVKTDYQSSNANYLTSQSNQALSGSNGSFNFQTATFGNSNGLSFYTTNGSMVGSYTVPNVPAQTNQTIGIYGSSQTTGQSSSSTYDARSLTIRGAGIVSVGNSGGEIIVSATGGGAADGGVGLSAGANSVSNGTVVFSNSNGLSFGLNGSTVTGSHNGLTSQSNQAVSAGNGSSAFQTLSLVDAGGVTWSTVAGGLQASVKTDYQSSNANYLTSQSNQAFSAQGGSSAFQTLSFTNSNGFSFSNTNGSIWGSYTVPTVTNSSMTMQAGASTLSSVSRVAFGDGNGISFGASTSNNGSITITASHNGLTSQSNQAFSASGGSSAFQTLNFANSNGLTFSNSNGSVIASYTVPTVTDYFSKTNTTFNGTNVSGSITNNTNGLRLDLSVNAGGANPAASASNGSFTFQTLGFSNANNVTFGTSAGSIVTASVAAPGAAAENNWVNLLGANTAGNTTASGSTIGYSGINATLSGTNGSVVNISVPATSSLSATGQVSLSTNGSTISIGVPGPVTYSRYNEFKESPLVAGEIGQASLHIQPWLIPNLQYDRVVLHKAFSNASNSSNSFTVSDWVGIYTRTGNTLSLLQSTSISTNFSGSGTVGSYLSYGGGIKAHTIGMTNTLTEGMYWIGVIQRTTTGGGAGHTLNQILNSQLNSSYRGIMGAATNASNQMSTGFGVYSVTTSGMPNSVGITELSGNSSIVLRPPSLYFVSGTI